MNIKFDGDTFDKDGVLGPFPFMSPQEAKKYNDLFFESIDQNPATPGVTSASMDAYHDRYEWGRELASHPVIVDAVSQALSSDDVMLWAMHFWYKAPHTGKYIPWHQDAYYWPIDPAINVTAWVALGPCTPENGCLRVIPGSHREKHEHVAAEDEASMFQRGIRTEGLDLTHARDVVMGPGEFVLFNENTLHGSNANEADFPRVAFSLRYSVPSVNLGFDPEKDDKIRTLMVKGKDRHHLNDAFALHV